MSSYLNPGNKGFRDSYYSIYNPKSVVEAMLRHKFETCCLLGLIIIKRPKNMHVSLRLCRNNISHIFPTKN